jgi:hypothetical protein
MPRCSDRQLLQHRGSGWRRHCTVGEEVIKLYRSIKEVTHMSAHRQRLALASLFASGDRRLFLG